MRAARPIALSFAVAITTCLIAAEPSQSSAASASPPGASPQQLRDRADVDGLSRPDASSDAEPSPAPAPSPSTPRMDYIPPSFAPTPAPPSQPSTSTELALGRDRLYRRWLLLIELEDALATRSRGEGRQRMRAIRTRRLPGHELLGPECVALATFIGSYRRRRWILSFTAGGDDLSRGAKRRDGELQCRRTIARPLPIRAPRPAPTADRTVRIFRAALAFRQE